MTDEERRNADEAHNERWMTRYGFVPPADPAHPFTKRFWELEHALQRRHTASVWRRFQMAIAETEAAFSMIG